MSARQEALDESKLRNEGLLLEIDADPDQDYSEGATAAVISITDLDGTAMIVETGIGPAGVFATVSGFGNDEPAEVRVFASENVAMLIVDKEE